MNIVFADTNAIIIHIRTCGQTSSDREESVHVSATNGIDPENNPRRSAKCVCEIVEDAVFLQFFDISDVSKLGSSACANP